MAKVNDSEMEASRQLQLTYQNLSNIWESKDPLDASRIHKKHKGPTSSESTASEETPLLHLLAKLALRQEQEIQSIRAQDSYVFHLNNSKEGMLQLLLNQGLHWSQQDPKSSTLRVRLYRTMTQELMNRFLVVYNAKPGSDAWKQATTKQIILEDGSWPTMEWSHTDQKYHMAKTASVKMQDMRAMVQDLVELGTDPNRIIRFYALQSPEETRTTVIWKLQLQLRDDNCHTLMSRLVNSTLWVLMAATMKAHRPGESSLTHQISSLIGKGKPKKGRGKGKGSGKSGSTSNTSSAS